MPLSTPSRAIRPKTKTGRRRRHLTTQIRFGMTPGQREAYDALVALGEAARLARRLMVREGQTLTAIKSVYPFNNPLEEHLRASPIGPAAFTGLASEWDNACIEANIWADRVTNPEIEVR